MMLCGNNELIMLLPVGHPEPASKPVKRWHVACFGRKRHYRKDGSCAHVDTIVASVKSDWYRSRLWYLPHGQNGQQSVRAWRGK